MLDINKINLNLDNSNLYRGSLTSPSYPTASKSSWCDIIDVGSKREFSKNYQDICQNHAADNKWILMVNPENDTLEQLHAEGKINSQNILKVNANKVNVKIEHIKNALLKGNCSALILSSANFNENELTQLSLWANQGKTQCIILKQAQQLH